MLFYHVCCIKDSFILVDPISYVTYAAQNDTLQLTLMTVRQGFPKFFGYDPKKLPRKQPRTPTEKSYYLFYCLRAAKHLFMYTCIQEVNVNILWDFTISFLFYTKMTVKTVIFLFISFWNPGIPALGLTTHWGVSTPTLGTPDLGHMSTQWNPPQLLCTLSYFVWIVTNWLGFGIFFNEFCNIAFLAINLIGWMIFGNLYCDGTFLDDWEPTRTLLK